MEIETIGIAISPWKEGRKEGRKRALLETTRGQTPLAQSFLSWNTSTVRREGVVPVSVAGQPGGPQNSSIWRASMQVSHRSYSNPGKSATTFVGGGG